MLPEMGGIGPELDDARLPERREVELSPVIATNDMPELAKLVDEAGADRLGISDVATLATRKSDD